MPKQQTVDMTAPNGVVSSETRNGLDVYEMSGTDIPIPPFGEVEESHISSVFGGQQMQIVKLVSHQQALLQTCEMLQMQVKSLKDEIASLRAGG